MRAIGLLFVAGAAIAQAPSFRPVATVSEIMIGVTYPYSDAMFYIERAPPKNDNEWKALEYKALMLAESGNLLMMEGRARDHEEWMQDSRLLVEAGMAAVKAVRTKDVKAVVGLNEQLVTSCTTCHTKYHPRYRQRNTN